MMNSAGFLDDHAHYRQILWAEGAATAMKVKNMLVSANKTTPAYKQFFGREAPYATALRTFGEIRIIHEGDHSRINWIIKAFDAVLGIC